VLKVASARPRAFTDEHAEMLEMLSGVIASHMVKATAFEVAERESRRDQLTGLGNRRAYEERVATELRRHARYGTPVSLCLLDLDGFKRVNDDLGHLAGDDVLRQVAGIIESRASDDAFRIGGDEFAVLLPHTSLEGAEAAARRLVEDLATAGLGAGRVTASAGVAEASSNDPEDLHRTADARLYEAKRTRA
jgi:diguanylate cyclase (GGDEF)-like protein